MRRIMIAAFCCLLVSTPAFATGNFDCNVDDQNLKLDVQAGYAYGGSGALFSVMGSVEIVSAKSSGQTSAFLITDEMLTQHWLEGQDLRLEIYKDHDRTDPLAPIEITILTTQQPDDELSFVGTYRLTYYPPPVGDQKNSEIVEKTGSVTCGSG